MKRLVLFDIDGTLVSWSPAHGEAFQEAYQQVYGVVVHHEVYPGSTDLLIIRDALTSVGVKEDVVAAGLHRAQEVMVATYQRLVASEAVSALPGVVDLLRALLERGAAIGLETGNLEGIAKAKLGRAGLWPYFCCGGYGSDDPNRTRIVELALSRARKQCGFDGDLDGAYLVGDSPRDMSAGREAGIHTVGVATSAYSVLELTRAGAEVALSSLTDTAAVLAHLAI